METYKTKFKLGDEARDTITGFAGVITCITFWLNGCIRIGIQPKELKDGKPINSEWIDEQQVELIEKNKKEDGGKKSGGPKPNPTAY